MNGKLVILLSACALILVSCAVFRNKEKSKDQNTHPKAELVANFDAWQNSASCTILSVSIEANIMTIRVEYSGGCEKHEFKLLGTEMIQKSLPPKRGIMLWHDNKGDSCRSIEETELKFDISAFAYAGGEIILNLDGWETPISYTFSK